MSKTSTNKTQENQSSNTQKVRIKNLRMVETAVAKATAAAIPKVSFYQKSSKSVAERVEREFPLQTPSMVVKAVFDSKPLAIPTVVGVESGDAEKMTKSKESERKQLVQNILVVSHVQEKGYEHEAKKLLSKNKEFIATLQGKTQKELKEIRENLEYRLKRLSIA